jgi:Na+-driven multidrug efflux pump
VIRFKSGVEEKVKIVYQSTDTLKYHLILESAVVRTVLMKQVDSIFMIQTERTVDTRTKRTVDTRKPERLGLAGLILSFPGFYFLIGLPLSILAVIFGAVSLRRVRRYPERYKKEFGLASLILGIIGIVVTAIFWIVYAVSV